MTNSSAVDKRKNKNFVINNKFYLKNFALKNRKVFGQGIIVINLLLLDTDTLDDSSVELEINENQEATIHQAIYYIPKQNFWYKMLNLKIKKKYQIDIQAENELNNKFLVVFVKDASILHSAGYLTEQIIFSTVGREEL